MKVFFKITTLLLTLISYQALAAFNNNPSSVGADSSGTYRNLAQEMGKTNIQQKVNSTFDNMFGYNNTQQLYYPYTENGVYKAHYIKAINPDEGDDIRTEGQSWGMTAAVMLNKQEEFDNLWRFAKAYQKNPDNHPDAKKTRRLRVETKA
ncbi:glycosyl hydrolase family 8 [Pseudoalteromonas distincta]|uniref:glycosyl hydrolase family 8 n=1 Tax=Pseudoalteromonas distincta TaxID=77608 RepID=UPI0032E0E2C7